MIGRDGEGHDPCDQPGDGDVLGHVALERNGDHGENIKIELENAFPAENVVSAVMQSEVENMF